MVRAKSASLTTRAAMKKEIFGFVERSHVVRSPPPGPPPACVIPSAVRSRLYSPLTSMLVNGSSYEAAADVASTASRVDCRFCPTSTLRRLGLFGDRDTDRQDRCAGPLR